MSSSPEVSIIIPAYNEAERIGCCLEAPMRAHREREWEVIVVDDASTDATADIAGEQGVSVIRLPENRGVAATRNAGAKAAHGKTLIFLDADIVAPVETLYALTDRLQNDPSIHAAGGRPADNLSPQWSSRFLYLQVLWYVDRHIRPEENVTCFPSECGAVRRESFETAGGFPETHGGVGMEEFALGHALERMGLRNVVLPEARYFTYYEPFGLRCVELMSRTSRWVPLFMRRRRLEPALGSGTPVGEAISCLLVIGMLITAFAGVIIPMLWWFLAGTAVAHLLIQSPWIVYVYRNEHGGLLLALLAWPVVLVMHLAIVAGLAWGVLRWVRGWWR